MHACMYLTNGQTQTTQVHVLVICTIYYTKIKFFFSIQFNSILLNFYTIFLVCHATTHH